MDDVTRERMNETVDRYFEKLGQVPMEDLEFLVDLLDGGELSGPELLAIGYLINTDRVNEDTYRRILASGIVGVRATVRERQPSS